MDYNAIRRKTRKIVAGGVAIGGDSPISIQSMTNTDSHDAAATAAQVKRLAAEGCDIVRVAVPDIAAVETIRALKRDPEITVPIVSDIHFDYRIALACAEVGVDKIRINPGNIGSRDRIAAVLSACREKSIPIRIGVNSGSLEKDILERHGSPSAEALAESALRHIRIAEDLGFYDMAVSVKSSNVTKMIETNRIISREVDYPIHLGVTEAGGLERGRTKAAVGLGALLAEGIGDTVRVSLTADPIYEVREAKAILDVLGIGEKKQIEIVSCPTCGRTKIDLIGLLDVLEREIDAAGLRDFPAKVAFMGCVVNGPGEAGDADVGIAGGVDEAVLFKRGKIIGKCPSDKIVPTLIDELRLMKKNGL